MKKPKQQTERCSWRDENGARQLSASTLKRHTAASRAQMWEFIYAARAKGKNFDMLPI